MKNNTLKARFKASGKASGIHLSLSVLAFLIVLYYIVFLWYPNPHFSASGGWQGVRIMLFVDIVLGPLLTLLIFSPEKSIKAILFDFTVIGAIQISAFIWGLSIVYGQRPLAISFWEGRFYPLTIQNLKTGDVKPEQIKELSHQHPAVIYSRKPETDEEEAGVAMLGYLYFPIEEHIDELFEASLANLSVIDDKFQTNKTHWLEKTDMNEKDLTFITFVGRYGNAILILNREGVLLDSIKVDL